MIQIKGLEYFYQNFQTIEKSGLYHIQLPL